MATASLPLVIEFLDQRDATWKDATSKAEATIMGPFTREQSSGLYRVRATVFVVLTSSRQVDAAVHVGHEGAIAEALDQCIVVKDYGTTGLVDIGVITPNVEAAGDEVGPDRERPKDTDDQIFTTFQVRYYGLFSDPE
jgi:hypothetical protein